jgi:hypothetical protein|tara:strand:+ start:519 stop:830 length:312 start_codon:yes stop_codon:yes gene_type:complete
MSNKLTEYRNKCLTQLEKHVAVERKWFGELLQHQESSMQLQTQNWYQSWKISYLEKKCLELGVKKGNLYRDLDNESTAHLSEWQKQRVKKFKESLNGKDDAKE